MKKDFRIVLAEMVADSYTYLKPKKKFEYGNEPITPDTMKDAGGDLDTYNAIKAKKMAKDKELSHEKYGEIAKKHGVEPNKGSWKDMGDGTASYSKNRYTRSALRKDIMGSPWAGKFDKKGKPFVKNNRKIDPNAKSEKPMPLNPKGKPKIRPIPTQKGPARRSALAQKLSKFRKDPSIRGKTVNTSRSTGNEGAKAQATSDGFNKFMQGLMRKNN